MPDSNESGTAAVLGDAVLDFAAGTLRRGGTLVPLRPKTFAMLSYLAGNRGRVVTKDELLDAVWPDAVVTEDSLTQCIRDARKAIGDEAAAVIRTVPRRGYLVEAPAVAEPPARPRIAMPTVAVLPFDGGREPRSALFAEAVVEELRGGLARFWSIAVMARHSSNRAVAADRSEPAAAGRRIGADYVVVGDVRSADTRSRLEVALVDVATGRHVWSEVVGFDDGELFAAVEQVVQRIATRLVSGLEAAELGRPVAAPTSSAATYFKLLRGIALLRSYAEGANEEAVAHLRDAVAAEPDSGVAQAYLALADLVIGGYQEAPVPVLRAARDRAARSVVLAPQEARCHRIFALILLFMREYAASERHFTRALELNPHDADTLAQSGYLLAIRGQPEAGLERLEKAVRINPLHPDWYDFDRSVALFLAGRFGEAARAIDAISPKKPRHMARLAACHALAGDTAAAARCLAEALRSVPGLDVMAYARGMEFERDEDRELMAEGMRRAMQAAAGAVS